MKNPNGIFIVNFLKSEAWITFTQLRKVFIKSPIIHHFDPEHYIRIEIDVSSYAISKVVSQMTLG